MITMKKSIIKYLVIFVILIIIISFTGYNLDTEPHNINTINHSQFKSTIKNQSVSVGVSVLKYVNLTYGNSKAEYVVDFHYIAQVYNAGTFFYTEINVYKLGQKLNSPITGISLEIKNIKLENRSSHSSLLVGNHHLKTYICNNTIEKSIQSGFSTAGNKSISVSFSIIPVYNMYIYHFDGKEQYFHYNYILKAIS